MRPIDADALTETIKLFAKNSVHDDANPVDRLVASTTSTALEFVIRLVEQEPTLRKIEKPDVQGRTVYKYRVNTPIRRGRRGKPSNGHLIASFGALMDLYVYRDKNDPLPDVEVIEAVGVKTDNIQLNKVVFLTRAEAEEKLDAVRRKYT